MPVQDLKSQISSLPEQPGVYLFANASGETIYVGKARALRDRVRSYLGARGTSPKTDALLDEADRLEVIVTDSVVEALALENHLIKQRSPKYNILLRDDKNYPYLQLTTAEDFPRVLVARRVERDGHVYAGPFMPASLARKTMALTHKLFGVRSCNEIITGRRDRPCLEYDIGRCIAPCVEGVCTPDRYGKAVEDARLFLTGRNEELVEDLRQRMLKASAVERFEEAAHLRDAMRTVQTLRERQQKIATVRLGDRDAFGVKVGPAGAVVQVFHMRGGRVIERVELVAEAVGPAPGLSEEAVLQSALQQFYEDQEVPPEIHLPVALEPQEFETLEHWLSQRAGRKVAVLVPRRGDRRGLVELAARNAALGYTSRFSDPALAHHEALERLRTAIGLSVLPRRIECFDISTIQGSETVGAVVVCEGGRLKKSDYRRFRIRGRRGERDGSGGPASGEAAESPPRFGSDDFAAMHEVVLRRYRRLLEQGGPFPDLVVIDGGRGQLSVAYDALEALGLSNLVAVGLAKKEELVYLRDQAVPIALALDHPGLLLLQRIRDEAHRFAVTFHRRSRRNRDLRSALDGIPGVGPRRRRALLERFGSVAGVRRASREELTALVGTRVAGALLEYFAGETPSGRR